MSILVVEQGTQEQSADEELTYSIDVSNWGSNPSAASAKAYDETTGLDVTEYVLDPTTGAIVDGISNSTITCPIVKSLVKGHTYRIEVKFTINPNEWECYFRVECTI